MAANLHKLSGWSCERWESSKGSFPLTLVICTYDNASIPSTKAFLGRVTDQRHRKGDNGDMEQLPAYVCVVYLAAAMRRLIVGRGQSGRILWNAQRANVSAWASPHPSLTPLRRGLEPRSLRCRNSPLVEQQFTSCHSGTTRSYAIHPSQDEGSGSAGCFGGLVGLSEGDQQTLQRVASDEGQLRAALEVLYASGALEKEERGLVDWERRDVLDQFGHSHMLRTFRHHSDKLFFQGIPAVMKAADEGVPGACFVAYLVTNMGLLEKTEEEAKRRRDPEKAVEWLKKAVRVEHGISMAHFARHFHQANREEGQDDTVAFVRWMEKAHAAGVSAATNALATATLHGYGVEKSIEAAVALYEKAAENRSAFALVAAAHALSSGANVDKHEAEIVKLLRRSVEMGRVKSLRALGDFYSFRGQSDAAFEAYTSLHNEGELEGTVLVADALDHGGKGAEVDKVRAAELYEMAATRGECHAQLRLGEMLMWADGIPQDYKAAEEWLGKAAQQGNDVAKARLMALKLGDHADPHCSTP